MTSLYLNQNNTTNFPGEANFILHEAVIKNYIPCSLNNIKQVNIFVGENNSGKSRFMRGIMQQNRYIKSRIADTFEKICNLKTLCNEFIASFDNGNFNLILHLPSGVQSPESSKIEEMFKSLPYKGILQNGNTIRLDGQYKPIVAEMDALSRVIFDKPEASDLRTQLSLGEDLDEITKRFLSNIVLIYLTAESCISSGQGNPYSIYGKSIELNNKISKASYELAFSYVQIISPAVTYIPTLRSARSLINARKEDSGFVAEKLLDLYADTIQIDYKIDISRITIETGLDLYRKIKRTRNQIREIRKGFEIFETFLSENFFGGKALEIVAKDVDSIMDEHISVLIDETERDIYLLGDGIQSLIILLYPVFMAKQDSFLFIEEPELNMHPGMQRIFMNTLLNNNYIKAKNLTIFITTHSNHLLNTSFDFKDFVSIFLFKRQKSNDEVFHNVFASHEKDIRILNNLGVINSSVFLSNCSIWIEGITDRKYVKAYLRCLINEIPLKISVKEDIHYSFLEYAGSNLSHYLFSDNDEVDEELTTLINGLKISNRILLIADLDKGKEKKHQLFRQQISSQFDYYPLPVLEVENLLSAAIVKKSLPELLNVSAVSIENIGLTDAELSEKSIGTYLKEKLSGIKISVSDSFEASSGTIGTYYKNKLADVCAKHITWENMSEDSKSLAKYILNFIINQNRGGAIDYDFAEVQ